MEQTQGAVMPKRSRNQELQTEKRILQLSVFADVCFVAAELLFAFASHFQSVLMDAAYDGAEMLMMAAAVCLTPLFYRPISEKYPFGYAQVESVFTAVKSAMMLSVMAGLTVNVIQTMLSGGAHVAYGAVSMFQLLLGLVSLCILGVMYMGARKVASPILQTEWMAWRLDVLYSMGMAAAFFGAKVLKDTSLAWMAPYVDQVVALLVVAFALPGAAKMFFGAVKDIFLFAPDEKVLEQVKGICEPLLQAYGFEPVFYDVTRTGRRMWVSVYFHTEGDVLSLDCMRQASKEAQKHLCEKWDYCVCELVPEQA